jgi:hypothetical protein
MTVVNYHVLSDSIVLNYSGKTLSVARGDKRFDSVLDAIRNSDLDVIPSLVDTIQKLANSGLEVKDGLVWLDGEALPDALSNRVIAFQDDNLPFEGLIKFARKLKINPSFNSRQQLFKFLEHNGHPITTEGNFIAYRGVTEDFKDKHTGKFDNSVGSVCEMPRDQVDDNPNNTCSNGLHVACHDYAKDFASTVVEVEIDPTDVVCVPTDYNGTKMRVCKFKVVSVSEGVRKDQLVNSSYEMTQTEIDSSKADLDWDAEDTLDDKAWPTEEDFEDIDVVYFEDSTAISRAEYNNDTSDLTIYFTNGKDYTHEEVPKWLFENLSAAESAGQFYHRNLKGKY